MGWRDRDYSQATWREPGAARGGMRRPPPATLALLIAHGVLFAALLIVRAETGSELDSWVRLGGRADDAQTEFAARPAAFPPLRPLAILLHPVSTARPWTLAFALCTLWILGGPLEERIGGRRLLLLYAAGSALAGFAYYLVAQINAAAGVLPLDYPVGAFAAWCLASWYVFAADFVSVLGRVTTRAKIIAICALISIGLALIAGGFGALAWLAGVIAGLPAAYLLTLLERGAQRPRRQINPTRREVREPVERVPVRVHTVRTRASEPAMERDRGIEVDEILAKISREGLAALTPAERERLEAARQAILKQSDPNAGD